MKPVLFLPPLLAVTVGCGSAPPSESISVENRTSRPVTASALTGADRIDAEIAPGDRFLLVGKVPKASGVQVTLQSVPPGPKPLEVVTVGARQREWDRGYLVTIGP